MTFVDWLFAHRDPILRIDAFLFMYCMIKLTLWDLGWHRAR